MHAGPALIFDLDGTLVDTAPDLLGATNAVLDWAGRSRIDPESLRHMVGFGARALIEQAMAATGPGVTQTALPGLIDIFIAHYRDHIADFSQPFAGVEATLDTLKAAGWRMGVLTNKPAELARPLLEKLGMMDYFQAVYGAGRKSYTKPDPQIFHDIVLDCGGGKAVMIGDSITDLSTARAANAPCILMSYGYTAVPAAKLGGDLVLDDFTHLPQALEKLAL